jgi:hypothetical protein
MNRISFCLAQRGSEEFLLVSNNTHLSQRIHAIAPQRILCAIGIIGEDKLVIKASLLGESVYCTDCLHEDFADDFIIRFKVPAEVNAKPLNRSLAKQGRK